jgi:potassium voltage-gated channel Eag-related subfamily H protein 5
MQPLEILNLKDYEDDYIRETDKIMLEDLRLKLNTRINFEIDAIKNYKYYYPEFNIQWLFKSIKVNYKFLE